MPKLSDTIYYARAIWLISFEFLRTTKKNNTLQRNYYRQKIPENQRENNLNSAGIKTWYFLFYSIKAYHPDNVLLDPPLKVKVE